MFSKICTIHDETPIHQGAVTCNTVFILAARTSTKKLIEDFSDISLESSACLIEVAEASSATFKDILSRQLKIIRVAEKGAALKNIDRTIRALESGDLDFGLNAELSVHGVRHLVNAAAKLKKYDNEEYELLSTVLCNPHLFRLYQFVDGNPDYSQTEEGVCNIYLVNRDPAMASKESRGALDKFDGWLLSDHLQTYWLKYFLCKYIEETFNSQTPLPISYNRAVQIFHSVNPDSCMQYEESLVKLALLHASKVDHGRLVKFGLNKSQAISVLPSKKLHVMFQRKVFWDFEYLMVIIEDKWLEFPVSIYEQLCRTNAGSVYDFVTKYHKSTEREKLNFVKVKAQQAIVFFLVLKVSLEYEMKRYKDSFTRLKDSGIDVDIIGDFESHLKNTIHTFAKHHIGDKYRKELEQVITRQFEDESCITDTIRKNLDGYLNYPCYRSINERMEQYQSSRV